MICSGGEGEYIFIKQTCMILFVIEGKLDYPDRNASHPDLYYLCAITDMFNINEMMTLRLQFLIVIEAL